MNKIERSKVIKKILDELYPSVPIPLNHTDPFTLLVAVLLSAQCTDERVNLVTPALFKIGPTPEEMAKKSISEIHHCIRTCGLANTKAKNVKKLAELFVQSYGAPDIIKASSVAEEEVNFMIDVCSDHDLGSLLTVFRTLENDGIHEKFRHIPKGDACSNQKIWTTVSDEN